jgi:hypothetical protein
MISSELKVPLQMDKLFPMNIVHVQPTL